MFSRQWKFNYPPVNKHSNGKSPSWIGNTSSNGGCSIAMLDYRRVNNDELAAGITKWLMGMVSTIDLGKSSLSEKKLFRPRNKCYPPEESLGCWFLGCQVFTPVLFEGPEIGVSPSRLECLKSGVSIVSGISESLGYKNTSKDTRYTKKSPNKKISSLRRMSCKRCDSSSSSCKHLLSRCVCRWPDAQVRYGAIPYLEDHPRTCKWLGSPTCTSHFCPFGRGTTPVRGLSNHCF